MPSKGYRKQSWRQKMKRIQNVDLATSGDNILLSRYEL